MDEPVAVRHDSWAPPEAAERTRSVDDMVGELRAHLPAEGIVVNGVFKGGGAKGVAYAGALQVCQDAGIGFKAVAGASAGAITATLVACGYDAYELESLLTGALRNIDNPKRAMLAFGRSSLLSRTKLEQWLDDRIRDQVPVPEHRRPTFGDITDHTNIDLYVVAMDLASRQPVVFSNRLDRDTDVISAVVASSAIPVAFEPVRMMRGDEVHRLIDGGTYSNYPEFVFRDAEFRRFHHLDVETIPTIGFSLEDTGGADPDQLLTGSSMTPVRRTRLSTDRGSLASETGGFGVIASSPLIRWAAVLAPIMIIVALTSMVAIETQTGPASLGWLPSSVFDPALLGLITILAIGSIGALLTSFVMARLGRDLLDVGVMGVLAATGVGPSVPYWFGAIPNATSRPHTVVRIRVPEGLTTLAFNAPQPIVDAAVAAGREATATTLLARATNDPDHAAATVGTRLADRAPSTAPDRNAIRKSLFYGAGIVTAGTFAISFLVSCFDALTVRSFGLAAGHAVGFVALTVLTLWITSRRKTRLRQRPYPILGTLPVPVLGLLAIGLTLSATTLVLFVGSDSTTVDYLSAPRYDGTVEAIAPGNKSTGQRDVLDVRFDRRPIDDELAVPAFYSSTLTACDGYDNEFRADTTCYRFIAPTSEFEIGQAVTVAVDTAAGVEHVVADHWLLDISTDRVVSLAVAAMTIIGVYHSLRCIRWRRDLAHCERLRELPTPAT